MKNLAPGTRGLRGEAQIGEAFFPHAPDPDGKEQALPHLAEYRAERNSDELTSRNG
jgi:hypothetical protein